MAKETIGIVKSGAGAAHRGVMGLGDVVQAYGTVLALLGAVFAVCIWVIDRIPFWLAAFIALGLAAAALWIYQYARNVLSGKPDPSIEAKLAVVAVRPAPIHTFIRFRFPTASHRAEALEVQNVQNWGVSPMSYWAERPNGERFEYVEGYFVAMIFTRPVAYEQVMVDGENTPPPEMDDTHKTPSIYIGRINGDLRGKTIKIRLVLSADLRKPVAETAVATGDARIDSSGAKPSGKSDDRPDIGGKVFDFGVAKTKAGADYFLARISVWNKGAASSLINWRLEGQTADGVLWVVFRTLVHAERQTNIIGSETLSFGPEDDISNKTVGGVARGQVVNGFLQSFSEPGARAEFLKLGTKFRVVCEDAWGDSHVAGELTVESLTAPDGKIGRPIVVPGFPTAQFGKIDPPTPSASDTEAPPSK